MTNPSISKIHSLLQSISLVTIRSTLMVVKFVLTLFIANYLDLESLGFFGLIMSATIMAPSIFGLGITFDIARNAVTQSNTQISEALKTYAFYIISLYIFIFIGSIVLGVVFDEIFLSTVCVALIFFEQINGEFYNLFLNLSRPFTANFYHFIRAALWAIIYMGLAFFLPEFRNLNYLLIFWLVASIITFILFISQFNFWKYTEHTSFSIQRIISCIISQAKTARFLYFNLLATSLSQFGDRYIISYLLGLKLTGIYIFFWQIFSALSNLINTGILQLYRPKLVRSFKEKNGTYFSIFKTCFIKSLFISCFLSFIVYISLYYLIPYLNKPDIYKNLNMVLYMFFGFIALISSIALDLILYSRHQDKLLFKMTLLVLGVSVISNFILVYNLGLIGAAIAFLVVGLFNFGLKASIVISKKLYID